MSSARPDDRRPLAGWQRPALACGCILLIVCAAGGVFDPAQFLRAYLASYLFYLGIALGGMVILMLHQLTGGVWGFLIRPILEAQMRTLPLLAVLFLPLAFGIGYLYPWAQPQAVAADAKLQYQQFYLNPPFFWIRAAVYFVLWLGILAFLAWWLRRQDRMGDSRLAPSLATFSGLGLVLYGITLHFAAIDWLMSLEPGFPSTIFGPLVASGQILSALAAAIFVFSGLLNRPPLSETVSLKALNDLGNFLLAMLVIWSYMVWFQFMIAWIANLPDDVIWYLPLGRGGWIWVAVALLILQFTVPFFLLLFRAVKQNPRRLGRVAGLILFMQLVFVCYEVIAHLPATGLARHWMDFLLPLGIGGIWLAVFLWQWSGLPILPRYDPNAEHARQLRQSDEEESAREESLAHG